MLMANCQSIATIIMILNGSGVHIVLNTNDSPRFFASKSRPQGKKVHLILNSFVYCNTFKMTTHRFSKLCVCVCVAFAISGRDSKNYEFVSWMLKLRMILESAWTCIDYNAFVENLKYCRFHIIYIIIYVWEKSCRVSLIVLSGNCLVRETTCRGNVQLPNNAILTVI